MLNLKGANLILSSTEYNIALAITNGKNMLLNELKINHFLNKEKLSKEIDDIEKFIHSNQHYYPLSAHGNIDINLRKSPKNEVFIELDYEMGIKEHIKIDWNQFKSNLLSLS